MSNPASPSAPFWVSTETARAFDAAWRGEIARTGLLTRREVAALRETHPRTAGEYAACLCMTGPNGLPVYVSVADAAKKRNQDPAALTARLTSALQGRG